MKLSSATVLVVDDEIGLLKIFRRWFELEGCRVVTAENGAVALDLASANDIDIVISDIRMPVMDGIELARQLRNRRRYLPKIIFISGFSDIDARESFDLGVESRLSKPIPREDLISAARRALMEPEERWRDPASVPPVDTLDMAFAGLADSRERGLIAFGKGGFCVRSTRMDLLNAPIALRLMFDAEHATLAGEGVVRWVAPADKLLGVEITHVDEACRSWASRLARLAGSGSFIPRDIASVGR